MCFSWAWVEQLLVWAIIFCAIIAILKLFIPFVLTQLGAGGGIIAQAVNIVLWAAIAIAVVYICFALISCLGGSFMPPLPHR